MAKKRITELATETTLKDGQYVAIDHTTDGTKKYDFGGALTDLKEDLGGTTRNLFCLDDLQIGKAWNGSANTARAIVNIPITGGEQYVISFTTSVFDLITVFEKASSTDTTNLYSSGVTSGFTRTANASATCLCLQFNKTAIAKSDFSTLDMQIEYGSLPTSYIKHYTAVDRVVRSEYLTYVTPEMYGAWGDGVHDDTVALQDALNTGKNVVANGKYLISASLVMTPIAKIGQRFEFNKIVCSTNNTALILNGRNGYVDGLYLESPSNGIRLGNNDIAYDWYIHVSWIRSTGDASMAIGGGGNVSECTIIGERFTYYSTGIYFDLSAGFVGQNRFIGIAFECINSTVEGHYAFYGNGSSYPMTGLTCIDVSLEGAGGGFQFVNSQNSTPITPIYCFGLRTSELTVVNGYKLLKLTGSGIVAGDIYGDIITVDSIDVSGYSCDISWAECLNFHGRIKGYGRGWRGIKVIGGNVLPIYNKEIANNVSNPSYTSSNLPYSTNLISGSATWTLDFPFEGEVEFVATSDGTTLDINGSTISMSNTQKTVVRTICSDSGVSILITRPNGTMVSKTLA